VEHQHGAGVSRGEEVRREEDTYLKRILIVGLIVVIAVLVIFRQRLFLRDPLATVERNGTKQSEYRVYLNYYNDILVEDLTKHEHYLVQGKDGTPMTPGEPLHLKCLNALVCLTETEFAPVMPLGGKGYEPSVEMTSAYVAYVDGDGASMRVALR
jgi:hypothetical protein